MKEQIELLRITRTNILKELEACTPEQLFQIPAHFNNNILWHAAHVIATLQVLVYEKCSTPSAIDTDFITTYRKGTFPSETVDLDLLAKVKALLLSSVATLEEDYAQNKFGAYATFTTSYGSTLSSVASAITFNNIHEGMHYGQIKMLKHLVG
jgi:hypothetical protein